VKEWRSIAATSPTPVSRLDGRIGFVHRGDEVGTGTWRRARRAVDEVVSSRSLSAVPLVGGVVDIRRLNPPFVPGPEPLRVPCLAIRVCSRKLRTACVRACSAGIEMPENFMDGHHHFVLPLSAPIGPWGNSSCWGPAPLTRSRNALKIVQISLRTFCAGIGAGTFSPNAFAATRVSTPGATTWR
jgi:hypothetical protein